MFWILKQHNLVEAFWTYSFDLSLENNHITTVVVLIARKLNKVSAVKGTSL